MNETAPACALPAQVQNAYRVGGAGSSLSYSLPLQVLQPRWGAQTHPCIPRSLKGVMCMIFCLCRPHFSLDVRTRSAEGLLFFAATRGGRSHLVLYMSKGRIRLSVGKQKEIFNREKYNDGRWHSVSGWHQLHPFDPIAKHLLSFHKCYHLVHRFERCWTVFVETVVCRSYLLLRRESSDWLWMGSELRMVSCQMLSWSQCRSLCHLCFWAVPRSPFTRS